MEYTAPSMNSVTQLVGGIWTHAAWPADLEHDKFYEELPAAMRADVAAEITQEIFDKSCFLSVLVCSLPPVACSFARFQTACMHGYLSGQSKGEVAKRLHAAIYGVCSA